jgi:light-regulated signal transduction histidine kinase (bacteriophytochrome)
MGELIENLLTLSQITRSEIVRSSLDVSAIARGVASSLRRQHPQQDVEVLVAEGLFADGDARLLTIVFENLLSNAWKFSSKRAGARIEVGAMDSGGHRVIFVRDNGAGFDMAYAAKLFGVFQRLHSFKEFEGTGIGLATVQRIVHRHGGRIWAEGEVERGATFFLTLDGS